MQNTGANANHRALFLCASTYRYSGISQHLKSQRRLGTGKSAEHKHLEDCCSPMPVLGAYSRYQVLRVNQCDDLTYTRASTFLLATTGSGANRQRYCRKRKAQHRCILYLRFIFTLRNPSAILFVYSKYHS